MIITWNPKTLVTIIDSKEEDKSLRWLDRMDMVFRSSLRWWDKMDMEYGKMSLSQII
jgi:hypothetical protein